MLGCIRCIKCIWNEFYQNVKGILILGLMWPDTLVQRAFFVMQAYLTDVWKLRFTHAAAIVNVWEGLSLGVFPPMFQFLADKHIGHFRVVLISSIASTVGIGFVTMSVPRGLAHSDGKCKLSCVDHSEKVLFSIGMVLTALGRAGLSVSLSALHDEEITHRCCGIIPCNWLQRCAVNTENYVVYGVGALFISLIKSWKLRFGIPAIFSAFATLWFLCCWCGFKRIGPKKRSPSDEDSVNNNNNAVHRFKVRKDKAKFGLLMVPVSITFIICGMVSSVGRSYFIEQANHMDQQIGILKVPLVALQLPILVAMICNDMVLRFVCKRERRSCIRRTCHVYLPTTGITVGMLLSVLCCVTSAKVEKRRLIEIKSHHLLSVAWLLIQYFLLEGMDSFFKNSIDEFYKDKAPESMKNYLHIITNAVYGLGYIVNVLLVYVVGKATGWFQETLDQSRLDQYYWVLAGLSGFNLLVFILLTLRYSTSKKLQEEPQEQQDQRGPSHRNSGEGEQQPPSGCWGT